MLLKDCNELAARPSQGLRTVIIGGGALGLYAASELVKRGREVVVIESGGESLDSFPPASYASVGKPHGGIRRSRSRSLGGTSNLWGGQLVEFQAADFAGREWLPDSKWPVTYEEISAYYKRTYENIGLPREVLEDEEVFKHAGGPKPDFQEGIELFLTRWLKVPSFAVAYRKQIQTSDKLLVLLHNTAVGFEGANGVIQAVKVADRHGGVHTVRGDVLILAAGTIEISRLLLHAAATPGWDCPWRDNPNVGAFFEDHLCARVAAVEVLDQKRFFAAFSTIVWSGQRFQPKLRPRNETLMTSRIMNIHGWMSFESSFMENLIYLKQFVKAAIFSRKISGVGNLFGQIWGCAKYLPPLMWRYMVDNRVFVPSTSKTSLYISSEQMPLRSSRITIDPSHRDPSGLPKVILDWRVGHEELASIREFVRRTDRALQAEGLARLNVVEDLASLNPKFLDTMYDISHHTGGARMAETAADGVVDRNLRVFGTQNLYIAGAASFRTTSNANITFPALTFATRLVDHLTQA